MVKEASGGGAEILSSKIGTRTYITRGGGGYIGRIFIEALTEHPGPQWTSEEDQQCPEVILRVI